MTYACSCGWSVQLEDGKEHKDIFRKHFQDNITNHMSRRSEDEDE